MADPKYRLRIKRIERVALVDAGDNPTAHVVIHKRLPDAPPAAPAAPSPDSPEPRWRRTLNAIGKAMGWPEDGTLEKGDAQTFDEIRGARAAQDDTWRFTSDLASSFSRILESEDGDKEALMRASLAQFNAAVEEALPTWIAGGAMKTETETSKGDGNMPGIVKATSSSAGAVQAASSSAAGTLEAASSSESAGVVQAASSSDSMGAVAKADLEKMRVDLEKAQQEIAAMRLEKRNAEFVEKAKAYTHLPVRAETLGPILRKIADGERLTAEELEVHEQVFAAANETTRVAALFAEVGSGGVPAAGSAVSKAQAAADELRKSDSKLSQADALAKVFREDRELALAYEREEQAAARAAAGR